MYKTRMKLAGVTAVCLSLGCWALSANAQTGQRSQTENTRRTNPALADEMFVRNAGEVSVSQVDLGKLAEEKAQNPQVKKFAQTMVEEHSKIDQQLKELGTSEHINPQTSMNRTDSQARRRLETSTAAGFDKAYLDQVASDLAREIGEFKKATSTVSKPALKDFAERTMPTLESELQSARQLAAHAR